MKMNPQNIECFGAAQLKFINRKLSLLDKNFATF